MPATRAPAVRRRRLRRRQEIIDAAWVLAHDGGVAQLSLRQLAAAVGMKAPSLYEYFDGKDGIYDAMFAEGYEALDAALSRMAATGDPRTDLLAGLELFLDFCAESLPRYQLMFTRVIPGWEPSPEAYRASVASFERLMAVMAAGGVTDPADIDLWTAISSGLAAQQAANDPDGDRYRALAPAAAQMFLAHVDRKKEHAA